MTALIVVTAIALLLVLRVPVYVAFGIPAAAALVFVDQQEPTILGYKLYTAIDNQLLLAAPLFLLMGFVLSESGIAIHVVGVFEVFLRHLPGGVGLVTVAAAVLFAGMTHSTVAELSALSMFTVPAMMKAGYDKRFALSLLGAAATLGLIFPPSIPMILYAYLTDVSVGSLFLASVIPTLVIAGIMGTYTVVVAWRQGWRSPTPATWGERAMAFKQGVPIAILPLLILLAIYRGIASPAEVGALAVLYAVAMAALVYRKLTWRMFYRACVRTAHLMSLLFMVLIAASLLSFFLALERIPGTLTTLATSHNLVGVGLMLAIDGVLLMLGLVLEVTPMLFLVVPVLLPTLMVAHVDLIYFAVVMMIAMQIAQVHPPVGNSVIVLSGIFKIDPMAMLIPMLPFIALLLGALLFFTLVPGITYLLR